MSMRSLVVGLGAVVAGSLVATEAPSSLSATSSEAIAAPGERAGSDPWNRPVMVAPRRENRGHDVVAGDRIAAVAWAGPDGVKARLRVPGTGWRHRVRLDRRGSDASLAINDRGDVALAWMRNSRHKPRLRVARRPVGGPWSRPVTVFRGTPANGTDGPDVSVGPRGKVTVGISIRHRGRSTWRPKTFTFANGGWGRAAVLSRRFGESVHVATDGRGVVTAAWVSNSGHWCASRGGGQSWSSPVCRGGPWNDTVEVTTDDAGRVYLMTDTGVWSSAAGSPWSRERVPGGVHSFGEGYPHFSVAASTPGRAVAAWCPGDQVGRSRVLWDTYASVRRPNGTWTEPAHLSDHRNGASAAIADDGTAYVAWHGRSSIRVARKAPGHRWTNPPALIRKREATTPGMAVNQTGNALVVFRQFYGARGRVWAAWRR